MTDSKVVLGISRTSISDVPLVQNSIQQFDWSAAAVLHWRRNLLWVKSVPAQPTHLLPAICSSQWLYQCLIHSPVQAVYLDPTLSETTLKRWANACQQVKKKVFLCGVSSLTVPQRRSPKSWMLKRVLDWLVAACLLMLLSPFFLLLASYVQYFSSQSVFSKEWCVGYRGKLFHTIKFRIPSNNGSQLTALEHWMNTYNLDCLPQLLNVLRGEMSLVGTHLWTLSALAQATSETTHKRLNTLPGVIAEQLNECPFYVYLGTANQADLLYLKTWSLAQDCKIILTAFKCAHRPQQ